MSGIGAWLLSIIGIIIIGNLIELILPDSNISKYVKSIYSFIVVFVIINPIIGLFNNTIDLFIWIINVINGSANSIMMLLVSIGYLLINIYGLIIWIKKSKK